MQSRAQMLLGVACVSTLALLYSAHRAGVFTSITFELKKIKKGTRFLVKNHRGEYKDAKKYAKGLPESVDRSVAIYWDDPRIMNDRCRFSVGIPCETKNSSAEATLMHEGDWIMCEAEEDMEAICTTFPYTGTLSAIIAAIRVYPLWVEETKRLGKGHGPIIKISPKVHGERIEFYFLTMPPSPSSSFMRCMSAPSN